MNHKEKFKNLPRTPWFPGSVRPHHTGVYERYFDQTGMLLLCYWDGKHWLAGLNPSSIKSLHQQKMWRGCSEDTTKA